ncbi:hypothetical protein AC578_7153 [Pseudocercospora eumusae]|uniref:Uncharacterized protein n=1 Tax=Pseudocercospora eumusae TaxID=321146 RepID=A0A139HWZ7_9PEZI|nr:hypothetical protein AC578_7153 [Pseudocercospora eumusae]
MATAEVARPQEQPQPHRRKGPFASVMKRLGLGKNNQQDKQEKQEKNNKKSSGSSQKHKKNNTFAGKNNPYPLSGHLRQPQHDSQPSFGASAREPYENGSSYASLPTGSVHDREGHSHSNKSGAPTLATNPETVHSEAGHSRAVTTSTGAGALSSIDGAGANSTFSSPNHSDHSLATTLTTIQSMANGPNPANGVSGQHHNQQSQPNGTMFSHQYPVSPAPSAMTASAIPRHLHNDTNAPVTYNSATANNLLTDNASILTLASSSKRRRRSIDTDASVRAIAPGSLFGGSRESLPLSVLSGGVDGTRQSIGGMPGTASAERASVYSSSGLAREIAGPALASERNSYYSKAADAKSLRSVSNIKDDARSQYDARSLHDVASLRSFDTRDKDGHHARNGSIPGSIGNPVNTPSLLRQSSLGGSLDPRRRSSEWEHDKENDADGKKAE